MSEPTEPTEPADTEPTAQVAFASAIHPDRELTPEERSHLGLPPVNE